MCVYHSDRVTILHIYTIWWPIYRVTISIQFLLFYCIIMSMHIIYKYGFMINDKYATKSIQLNKPCILYVDTNINTSVCPL